MTASLPTHSEPRVTTLPTRRLAALAIGVLIVSAIVPLFQARPGATVAAIFPPWWSRDATILAAARANVAIVALSRLPNVVIVSTDRVEALARLYQTGAWSLLGTDSKAGCFVSFGIGRAAQRVRGS